MSRRAPGQKVSFAEKVTSWTKLDELLKVIQDRLNKLIDQHDGDPSPHAATHKPQTGSDKLSTAAPSNATGTAAAAGIADTLLRSDSTTKQGIVTIKGDVLGYSTVPARIPVGTDGQVLTADSPSALGVKWAAGGGGGGSTNILDLVEAHEVVAPETSFTFTTVLDGDADEIYLFQYRILDVVGGSFFTIRPNALTTNQRTKRQLFGSFAGAGTDSLDLALCDPNAFASGSVNDVFSGHGWFYSKTGAIRLWQNIFDWYRASDAALFGVNDASYWTDTTTKITSFSVFSNTALAIGAGSYVRLYKLRKVAAASGLTYGTPTGLANSNVAGVLTSVLRSDAKFKRDVRVQKSGIDIGTRNALNFTGDVRITDDATGDAVDIRVGIPLDLKNLGRRRFFSKIGKKETANLFNRKVGFL